jgi:CelD/BcsL family acetyltransferase involved in cellulose biosynthesis
MMTLEIIRELSQWQPLHDEWNELLARSALRVPCLRHGFLTAWWAHLGGCGEWPHGELHAVLAREGGRLVAAAALFASVDREQSPVIAFVGSDAMADYLDVLAEPECLAPFVDALLDHLASPEAPVWRSIDLFNLCDDSPTGGELLRAAAARGWKAQPSRLSDCRHIPLEANWERYLARRVEKKHRHEIRRKLRRAAETPGLRWYFVEEPAAIAAAMGDLSLLLAENREKRDFLSPSVHAQWLDFLLAAHRGGWLRLAFLEIEGVRAAGCVAFDLHDCLWISNMGFDPRYRGLSPGSVLLSFVLQWAISAGRKAVDFLRGDEDFKLWFGSEPRGRYCLRLFAAPSEEESGDDRGTARAMDDAVLAAGLGAEAIVARGELPIGSSTDCEIVTCRTSNERLLRLFCKFGRHGESPGLAYEAQVYDELLHAWPGDVPPLHGLFLDDSTSRLVLALEYLKGGTPLDQVSQPKAGLLAAARWIARFHLWGETVSVPAFVRRCDTEFYRQWLRRVVDVSCRVQGRYPWLPALCERGMRRLPALLPPGTIIHGEYQANNILMCQGRNVAIDWDSAALGAGESDLANLTWGWDEDLASLCEQQYCLSRWPDGTPDDFDLRLAAARVFLHLRWLGDREGGNDVEAMTSSLDELAPLAAKFAELDR